MKLNQQVVRNLFDYKDGILYWKVNNSNVIKIGSKAGTLRKDGYYKIGINGKNYLTHQLIYLYHYGYIPKEIDHIDNNPSNNKINNLRKVTRSQNNMNKKSAKNSSSIYKGVGWFKRDKLWVSQIQINGKLKYLGRFTNEIDAVKAYNKKAIELFGEYANLNEV